MMKRTRTTRRPHQSEDGASLIRLASELSRSSSRVEDDFWNARLADLINRLLADRDEDTLLAALDKLYNDGDRAYDELADAVESCVESSRGKAEADSDILLIAVPVLAWSRYQIPAGTIPAAELSRIATQLAAHILAADTRLALCDFMYSPDQLPQSYGETAQLAERLFKAAPSGRHLAVDPRQLPETVSFLSDTRYLLGAVAAPRGGPIFRWQEADGDRTSGLREWARQGGETLRGLLPACAVEFQLPQAFHAAIRDADRASRPYSVRAAVAFLVTTLNCRADQLRAVVAPFHDKRLEEYRVGFTRIDANDVLHGVVWPLLDMEDEGTDIVAQIEAALTESGIGGVIALDHRFPLEFCDDCGVPLYPNPEGEPVHAELPEDSPATPPRHLH